MIATLKGCASVHGKCSEMLCKTFSKQSLSRQLTSLNWQVHLSPQNFNLKKGKIYP